MLPYGHHGIDDDDIDAVVAALRSDWLTTGPAVAAFEAGLAASVKAPHAVACANGTAALHLAVMALGIGPGDGVIVPAITFVATANVVRFAGADVLFADVDPETGLMGPDHLEKALAAVPHGIRPMAAIPVHLNGQACDMPGLAGIATHRGLSLIEDACHALGTAAADGGWTVGDCRSSAMACFSFHPVKTVTMGEGGAVTTRDPELAGALARRRNHGLIKTGEDFSDAALAYDRAGRVNPWYYEMPEIGFNYRASDINCALGCSQLAKLNRFVARRREIVAHYDERLASLAPAVRPLARRPGQRPGWHLYPVLIDFDGLGLTRAEVMASLRSRGVMTQVHYIPVYRQPYYRRLYGDLRLPGAERYYGAQLSLPLFAAMTPADVERCVDALAAATEGRA